MFEEYVLLSLTPPITGGVKIRRGDWPKITISSQEFSLVPLVNYGTMKRMHLNNNIAVWSSGKGITPLPEEEAIKAELQMKLIGQWRIYFTTATMKQNGEIQKFFGIALNRGQSTWFIPLRII